MTEEVGKKVCEGTVADLMKDKTGKQTVVTLTRKNAYRVKKIRKQGTDDKAVLFHFRKRCTGMGSYVHTIETAEGETELHPNEFEKWEAVEFLYPGYLEDMLDIAYNAYRWSSFEPEARAETDIMQYERQLVDIIRKSKFPQNPKRSVRFSGKGTKRSVQKRKARNTQKAETKVL